MTPAYGSNTWCSATSKKDGRILQKAKVIAGIRLLVVKRKTAIIIGQTACANYVQVAGESAFMVDILVSFGVHKLQQTSRSASTQLTLQGPKSKQQRRS